MDQITQAFGRCTSFYSELEALGDFEKRMPCFNLDLKKQSLLEEDKDKVGSPVTGCRVREYLVFLT